MTEYVDIGGTTRRVPNRLEAAEEAAHRDLTEWVHDVHRVAKAIHADLDHGNYRAAQQRLLTLRDDAHGLACQAGRLATIPHHAAASSIPAGAA